MAKVSGGCKDDRGPKAWAQINLLFNLIMQRGIGCLSPINTTVIAFEEEWEHTGPQRYAHTQVYTGVHRTQMELYYTNMHGCGQDEHTGAHTHILCVCVRLGGKGSKWEKKKIRCRVFGWIRSRQSPCGCMCVHVYMARNAFKHGALLISMVISKQRGVVRTAVYY